LSKPKNKFQILTIFAWIVAHRIITKILNNFTAYHAVWGAKSAIPKKFAESVQLGTFWKIINALSVDLDAYNANHLKNAWVVKFNSKSIMDYASVVRDLFSKFTIP
jgi:hypothetical protein